MPLADLPAILLRPSTAADIGAIAAIYADAVLHGTGTFELDAPDVAEMVSRRGDVLAKGLPWLVAVARQPVSAQTEGAGALDSSTGTGTRIRTCFHADSSEASSNDGQVLGYAYASHFRPRPAYRHTFECSVYVQADARGRGIGRLLMLELMARAEALGARQMTAVIGDADNLASIALHRALGFAPVGTLRHVGRKFDRWLDVVLMQRELGPGSSSVPSSTPSPTPSSTPTSTSTPQSLRSP